MSLPSEQYGRGRDHYENKRPGEVMEMVRELGAEIKSTFGESRERDQALQHLDECYLWLERS